MKKTVGKLLSLLLSVCLMLGCTAISADAYGEDAVTRVSCTVQGDTASCRAFCWYTNHRGNSDVQIVKEAEFSDSFENAESFSSCVCYEFRFLFCHKVSVYGLEAGTAYCYRVGDAAKELWSDVGRFVTDDGNGSFSFITIADVQSSTDDGFAHAAQTIEGAMRTLPDSAFTVNLGDFVDDDTNAEWDGFFKHFAVNNMATTLVPVAGNHDGNFTNKPNINVFNSMFNLYNPDTNSATNWVNGVYYSFDYGNAHFAVLNTNDMFPMTQSQRNWLVNDMKASGAMWKFVLMHRAAYSEGKNINKPDTIVMRDVLLPLFDELDIDVVFAGHDHTYYRSQQVKGDKAVKDVTYVTEDFHGESTTFAYNPEGSVHILPATAGTKRYAISDDAIYPIAENCAYHCSTEGLGGCFLTTEIDGNRLVMKTYVVNDATQDITLLDSYAIKKDSGHTPQKSDKRTDTLSNAPAFAANFASALVDAMTKYAFVLLPQLVGNRLLK